MERFGLGYEKVLASRFPRLVHCRISGFGSKGPLGGLPGYDYILQAMTGLMSMNGDPRIGTLRLSTPCIDLGTGLYAVIGILMALLERHRSGRGQYLDMTLYDCGISLLYPQASRYLLDGIRPFAPHSHALRQIQDQEWRGLHHRCQRCPVQEAGPANGHARTGPR